MDASWVVPGALIVLLSAYLLVRIMSSKPVSMQLDKGGHFEDGRPLPDFNRADLQEFLAECAEASIPEGLAKEFIVAMYSTMNFHKEPPAPHLSDGLVAKWDFDDDIEYPLNYILSQHDCPRVRWNQTDVGKLATIEDVLVYLREKTQHRQANQAL